MTNTAAPTLGTLSVKPLTVFGHYDVTSTLAHSSESGFMNWLRDSLADLLHNQLVAALFDGDPTDNKIEGFLRKTGYPTVYFGAALTEASIRSCVSLLRTNLGVGTMPVWLLSEGYRNAAVAGGWASETGVHTGVMLPDDAGGGIHYVVSQHLQHPAGADPLTDPEVVAPAILCYGDSWRIPIWGLMASQHMQPDRHYRSVRVGAAVQQRPAAAQVLCSHPRRRRALAQIWVPPKRGSRRRLKQCFRTQKISISRLATYFVLKNSLSVDPGGQPLRRIQCRTRSAPTSVTTSTSA